MDRVEEDVSKLNTSVSAIGVQVGTMATQQSESAGKLDQLLARGMGQEATKGMVPVSYITWAIGALISFTGVGLTILTIAAAVILFAMNHNAEKDGLKIDIVTAKVEENHEDIDDIEVRVGEIEKGRFDSEQGDDMRERIAILEADLASEKKRADYLERYIEDNKTELRARRDILFDPAIPDSSDSGE